MKPITVERIVWPLDKYGNSPSKDIDPQRLVKVLNEIIERLPGEEDFFGESSIGRCVQLLRKAGYTSLADIITPKEPAVGRIEGCTCENRLSKKNTHWRDCPTNAPTPEESWEGRWNRTEAAKSWDVGRFEDEIKDFIRQEKTDAFNLGWRLSKKGWIEPPFNH